MKMVHAAVFFSLAALTLSAQHPDTFTVEGSLHLIDGTPDSTPVEALAFQIHPLAGGPDLPAQPDRNGEFVLSNVRAGRYSLTFPMPGHLRVFAIGAEEVSPSDFQFDSDHQGPLSIVVSMQSTTIDLNVAGLRTDQTDAIALLVPSDDRLTLRTSCFSIQLTGPEASFPFVAIGKYRVLVFNGKYGQEVSAYAPRIGTFLSNESVIVEASPGKNSRASASFIPDETVEAAIEAVRGTPL